MEISTPTWWASGLDCNAPSSERSSNCHEKYKDLPIVNGGQTIAHRECPQEECDTRL